jgi:AcrR family transcriptional regulator
MNTRKIILQSFYHLLQTSSLDAITTDMLIRESEISKSTFYRLFRDKYELVNAYYCENIDRIFNDPAAASWNAVSDRILGFLENNRLFFQNAFKNGPAMSDFILQYTLRSVRSRCLQNSGLTVLPQDIELIIQIYCLGALALLEKWVSDDIRCSKSEISRLLCLGIPEPLAAYL